MATNPLGKNKKSIGTSISVDVHNLITQRAQSLGITKSNFLRLIIEDWYNKGANFVSNADEAIMFVEEKRAEYNKKKKK